MSEAPQDFDWVTARARCSAVDMFETLRAAAKTNVATRNGILDESGDKGRFKFKDTPPRGFTVWDTWAQNRRAVDVEVEGDRIRIDQTLTERSLTVRASLTLNNDGECKFKIDGDELNEWQVLKFALEALFFEP